MRVHVLASGSGGNATVIEANGTRILIDCGLSYRQLGQRMGAVGIFPADLDAVFITHEHDDHVGGLAVFARRNPKVPILATAGTGIRLAGIAGLGEVLVSGATVQIGALTVVPVSTAHDAREPVAFVCEHGACRVGLVTDTGVITSLLAEHIAGCHALLLEFNHDADMLRLGPYPWTLKQRIAGRSGHLSNHQARKAVEAAAHEQLEAVVAMHLSRENNTPAMVARELREVLAGSAVRVAVADQFQSLSIDVAGGAV